MPPNNKEVSFNINQAALPYHEPAYKNISGSFNEEGDGTSAPSEGSGSREVQESNEGINNVRVATRARLSYELDRYSKNAMLIIDNRAQLNSTYYHYTMKEAFEKYRFEVESYEKISRDEIIAVCERYFQKDFSAYGAVAVALMADVDGQHRYMAKNSTFTENDVLKYFTTHQPATLVGKPKISIVEASDFYYNKRRPIQQPDYLRLHTPVVYSVYPSSPDDPNNKVLRPIQVLCKDIIEKGDTQDLYTLMVSNVVNGMKICAVQKMFPVKIESTLKKDLMLFSNVTS